MNGYKYARGNMYVRGYIRIISHHHRMRTRSFLSGGRAKGRGEGRGEMEGRGGERGKGEERREERGRGEERVGMGVERTG
jgi:hypothetical protein